MTRIKFWTAENIPPNGVIVVGTHTNGDHCAGLALQAKKDFGLKEGHTLGYCGKCFCIDTSSGMHNIVNGLKSLNAFAKDNPHLQIIMTKIGTGIAGYSDKTIRNEVFEILNADNITMPPYWFANRMTSVKLPDITVEQITNLVDSGECKTMTEAIARGVDNIAEGNSKAKTEE